MRPTIRRPRLDVLVFGMSVSFLLAGCATPEREPSLDEGALVRGDRTRRELALVFTGGEYGEGTEHILGVLRDEAAAASFFVTGDFLARPDQRATIPRMLADGHYVGPHSHSHPLYCTWEDRDHGLVTEAEFRSDLELNLAELRALGALPPTEPVYFIPPYEWFNRDHVRWSMKMGIVLFNFTPGSGSNRDWIPEGHPRFVDSDRIREGILEYERSDPDGLNGFLLLLHLGSERQDKMHLELRPLIRELARRGYRFRRVDTLLQPHARAMETPS